MVRTAFLAFMFISAGGAWSEIAAQESSLEPGARLRVTAPDCGLQARVTKFRALRDDTLVFQTAECPLTSVTHLDVSRGQRSHAALGAGLGLAAGALGAVVFCKVVENGSCDLFDDDITLEAALITGAIGGIVGGIVGHLIKTDVWEEFPLERLRTSVALQLDGRIVLGLLAIF